MAIIIIMRIMLKHFKKGAKLINLSRGGIVNNADIIDALNSKQISTFVTDFPTPELVDRSSDFNDVIDFSSKIDINGNLHPF